MKPEVKIAIAAGLLVSYASICTVNSAEARGPLRIHPENPRYFTDGTKTPQGQLRALLLTGAHTWNNLVDMGKSDPVLGQDKGWGAIRTALGLVRHVAGSVELSRLSPQGELSSTKYCLAEAGREYLVYQPAADREFTVQLKAGKYGLRWIDPANGTSSEGGSFEAPDGQRPFKAPFSAAAVLLLQRAE